MTECGTKREPIFKIVRVQDSPGLLSMTGKPMAADALRILSLCRAIDESSDIGLAALDREDILAVHRTLTALKGEIEQLLSRLPLETAAH